LNARLPHLVDEWVEKSIKEFGGVWELPMEAFGVFVDFVREETSLDEEILAFKRKKVEVVEVVEDVEEVEVVKANATEVKSVANIEVEEKISEEGVDTVDSGVSPRLLVATSLNYGDGCLLCGDVHLLMRCRQFLAKSPNQRWRFCKLHGLCFKCLGLGHVSKYCHHRSCSDCGRGHHSVLHGTSGPSSGRYRTPSPSGLW
jgi:hypothetical protein